MLFFFSRLPISFPVRQGGPPLPQALRWCVTQLDEENHLLNLEHVGEIRLPSIKAYAETLNRACQN